MDLAALKAELERRGELRIRVKVTPKSAKTELTGALADGTLKIRVAAPPEKGKANAALCAFLAQAFGVASRNVAIQTGETSPLKRITISASS